MKKIFIYTILCSIINVAQAQEPIDGNLAGYSGTQPTNINGCTYLNGQLPGWIRTHGSSHYLSTTTPSPSPPPGWGATRPSIAMSFDANSHKGDGVAVNCHFKANHCYKIYLAFDGVVNNNNSTLEYALIKLYATTGLIEGPVPPSSCQDVIPGYVLTSTNPNGDPFQKEIAGEQDLPILGGYQSQYIGMFSDNSAPAITYTPTEDNDQLWIYPSTSTTNMSFDLYVNYVVVMPCDPLCDQTLTFNNGHVSPNLTYKAGSIYAGSSFGGPQNVIIDNYCTFLLPTPGNYFIAKDFILFAPNFEVSAPVSNTCTNFFSATIDNNICSGGYIGDGSAKYSNAVPSTGTEPQGSIYYTEPQDIGILTSNINKVGFANEPLQFSIYPNPTTDKINISYPCSSTGNLEIKVQDMAGRVYDRETVQCAEGTGGKYTIDATNLLPGTYIVDLTLNDQHVVKKVVKLKN